MSESITNQDRFDIGRPLTTYHREPEVQAALEAWGRLSPRVVMQKLRADASRAVSNEAMVAIARAYLRVGSTDDAWAVAELLSQRTVARTHRHFSVWGSIAARHHEDITRDILKMMIDCVLSLTPQNEFWECRFWTCFDRRVRSILRDFSRSNPDETGWDDLSEAVSLQNEPADSQFSGVSHSDSVLWTDRIAAKDALARLPEPLRTAFYLKYHYGYKEESKDDEPTIASTLNVTGRSVRNYLRRAEELLTEWRREELTDD